MVYLYYTGKLPKGVKWETPMELDGITSDGIKSIAMECNMERFKVIKCCDGRFDMFDNDPYVGWSEFPLWKGYYVIKNAGKMQRPTVITDKLLSKYIRRDR